MTNSPYSTLSEFSPVFLVCDSHPFLEYQPPIIALQAADIVVNEAFLLEWTDTEAMCYILHEYLPSLAKKDNKHQHR
jgi:hypothetical protein